MKSFLPFIIIFVFVGKAASWIGVKTPPHNSLHRLVRPMNYRSVTHLSPVASLSVKDHVISAVKEKIQEILIKPSYRHIRGLGFSLTPILISRITHPLSSRIVSVVRTADIWWTALNVFVRWVCLSFWHLYLHTHRHIFCVE